MRKTESEFLAPQRINKQMIQKLFNLATSVGERKYPVPPQFFDRPIARPAKKRKKGSVYEYDSY